MSNGRAISGQLELWQRVEAQPEAATGDRDWDWDRDSGREWEREREGEAGTETERQKQSNIHLLFNTKTQFVHSPGNHQQTSPAGILTGLGVRRTRRQTQDPW